VVDPNLEFDPRLLDSMQKLNVDLGYLKYTDFLSVDKIFTFTIATGPCRSSAAGEPPHSPRPPSSRVLGGGAHPKDRA
jgi:hypothetical protein